MNPHKIIYGLSGEGMGHAIRSEVLLKELIKKYEVKIFASGRAFNFLSKKFKDVNEIEGVNIVYKNNKAIFLKTAISNFKKFNKIKESYKKVKNEITNFQPDLIISDFDPITLYAGKSLRKKCLSLSNQSDITFKKSKPPLSEFSSFLAARIVTISFVFKAEKKIIYSFIEQEDTKDKIFLGNFIREDIRKRKSNYKDYTLVYQTSNTNIQLINILKEIKEEKFIIYGFEKDCTEGNLIFRKFNTNIFFEDMTNCKSLIANGGLTTLGEAVYLKKPILAIPVKKQFEQYYNAKTIEKLGFGKYLCEANKSKIIDFLKKNKQYIKNLKKYKTMSNKEIINKIEGIIKDLIK